MDSSQFREAATSAIDEIVNYYDNIQDRRVVSNVEPGYLKKLLPNAPPEEGEPWEDIQKDIETKIMPGLTHWQSPNFMAFFPASSSYPGMLGELYSAAFTAPAFNWICSPAVTELETIVLDWLATLLGLPDCYLSAGHGGGVIQGSASEAIVTTMVAARDKYLRETTSHLSGIELEDIIAHKRSKMVALGSDQAHSSTQKAAQISGVRYRSIPALKSDGFAMTGARLEEVLNQIKAQGLEPFYLTTTLGTTATCAVDDFASIAETLSRHAPPDVPGEIWVHVDAAYAGAALVCPEYQYLTSSFKHFHSFDMNMHKWLLTNFDASCLYVKKRKDLIDALSIMPTYLRNEFSDSGLVIDYRDWQIPLGRRFRSLKIWFVLRTYGVKGLQEHIRKHVKLGEGFAQLLRSRPDLFRIHTKPSFALTVFDLVPTSGVQAERTALTRDAYDLINSRGEIYITSSMVAGTYVMRVVSANPKAEEKYLKKAFDILVATTEEVRLNRPALTEVRGVMTDIKGIAEAAVLDVAVPLTSIPSSGLHLCRTRITISPRSSVNMSYFSKTDHTTHCPWKGDASYYSINLDETELKNAAWYYPTPKEKASNIKHYVAFFQEDKPVRPNEVTLDDLKSYISAAADALSPLDYEIRTTQDQITKERSYVLVNSISDPLTQLATIRTTEETLYIKRLLDAMFETYNTRRREVMAITSMQAMERKVLRGAARAGQRDAVDKGLTGSEAERLLQSLVREKWLERSAEGFYRLSTRGLMDLRSWLVETYNEVTDDPDDWQRVKECIACREIITIGQRCGQLECNVRLHDICETAYWNSRPNKSCPKCEREWDGEHFVGQGAVINTEEYTRGQRRSGPKKSRRPNDDSGAGGNSRRRTQQAEEPEEVDEGDGTEAADDEGEAEGDDDDEDE
ncbi:putative tyrosine decarboxylase 1 [Amylocarpus encephaloides]|uniref:Non-structural maintenance of chromosomes element 1 homolog n=1 Tax=Amylocarpus encephaloides TaxID=45428 RepID=A0A9P7Y6G6_9HELO|nr:putative tyrosine decarboxylase 1 [Amylocarpus encephaloides]